jgi:hypothetical protein
MCTPMICMFTSMMWQSSLPCAPPAPAAICAHAAAALLQAGAGMNAQRGMAGSCNHMGVAGSISANACSWPGGLLLPGWQLAGAAPDACCTTKLRPQQEGIRASAARTALTCEPGHPAPTIPLAGCRSAGCRQDPCIQSGCTEHKVGVKRRSRIDTCPPMLSMIGKISISMIWQPCTPCAPTAAA